MFPGGRAGTRPPAHLAEPTARGPPPGPSCARSPAQAAPSSDPLLGALAASRGLLGAWLELLFDLKFSLELAELPLGPRELARHDRDVDQDQGHERDVGSGHIGPRRMQGQRGDRREHTRHDGAALLPRGRTASSPKAARRKRRSCMRASFAAISYFHSVAYSSATPTSEITNVSPIDPGRWPPVSVSTRG